MIIQILYIISAVGINRTFMELKSISFVVCKVWNQYQSNLYGIEIEIGSVYKRLNESINRTFMELKSATPTTAPSLFCVSIEPLWNWNSSNCIYHSLWCCINRTFMELKSGIRRLKTQTCLVSIEPLWNWNAGSTTSNKSCLRYQSNLYGIEIFINFEVDNFIYRINRTFMELKYARKAVHRPQQSRYQSNLYGIEMMYL